MRAVFFDHELRFVENHPMPEIPPGWALIQVRQAGICGTDIEMVRGYREFKGVLGHEFVGIVNQCDDSKWIGMRVVGEINAACGQCDWCTKRLERHCPNRTVLGILDHDGCMADYCVLPVGNLIEIPEEMPNTRAIFIEPISSACEILEQMQIKGTERAIILGDGRLGIFCAWVLSTVLSDVTLIGRHPKKLESAKWKHLQTALQPAKITSGADIVVDATGSVAGIKEAISFCRPRGTIVLKSTVASPYEVNLAPIVINELTVLGSRCGQFKDGLRMLQLYPDMPLERLITARYSIEQAVSAFVTASKPDTLKVLIDITAGSFKSK